MNELDPNEIASALLEDVGAKLPSKKAEVKILPAHGLEHHHDIVLISDHAPLYIGTIAPKHSVWRVVKTANNIGRGMRAALHWHMPTKEECAIRMVEVMRPYWKPIIERHGFMDMFEDTRAEIDAEAENAEKPASDEQAEAGNYKKGHVSVQGLQIAVENAKGSTRSGVNKAGKSWSVTLPAHYGYIKGTVGKDKDHLDVYIGDNPGGMLVFVVNQQREEGGFDEHKIMLGFSSKDEAIDAYDRAFTGDLGPKLRESVVSTTVDKLKNWIKNGNTKKPFENLEESRRRSNHWFSHGFSPVIAKWIAANVGKVKCRMGDLACEDMSIAWGRAIKRQFPEAHVTVCGGMYYTNGDADGEGHSWLEVNGSIFDPTAAQFSDYPAIDEGNYFETEEQIEIEAPSDGTSNKIVEALLEDDAIDPKEFAQKIDPELRYYGELKPGMVLYDETGAYNRVEKIEHGPSSGTHYQDENGVLIYDPSPGLMVALTQFSPSYAYGRFVKYERYNSKAALLGTEVVQVKDNSDEALWALVDAETDQHRGPGTAARNQAAEQERRQQPAYVEAARARAEMRRMMGGAE